MIVALQWEGGETAEETLLSQGSWQMPRVPPARYIGHSTLGFPFLQKFPTLPFRNHTTCHVGLTDFFFYGKGLLALYLEYNEC
jgi:hypothetical protein